MLAMNLRAPRSARLAALSLTTIAIRLASTVDLRCSVEFSRRGGVGLPGSFMETT